MTNNPKKLRRLTNEEFTSLGKKKSFTGEDLEMMANFLASEMSDLCKSLINAVEEAHEALRKIEENSASEVTQNEGTVVDESLRSNNKVPHQSEITSNSVSEGTSLSGGTLANSSGIDALALGENMMEIEMEDLELAPQRRVKLLPNSLAWFEPIALRDPGVYRFDFIFIVKAVFLTLFVNFVLFTKAGNAMVPVSSHHRLRNNNNVPFSRYNTFGFDFRHRGPQNIKPPAFSQTKLGLAQRALDDAASKVVPTRIPGGVTPIPEVPVGFIDVDVEKSSFAQAQESLSSLLDKSLSSVVEEPLSSFNQEDQENLEDQKSLEEQKRNFEGNFTQTGSRLDSLEQLVGEASDGPMFEARNLMIQTRDGMSDLRADRDSLLRLTKQQNDFERNHLPSDVPFSFRKTQYELESEIVTGILKGYENITNLDKALEQMAQTPGLSPELKSKAEKSKEVILPLRKQLGEVVNSIKSASDRYSTS